MSTLTPLLAAHNVKNVGIGLEEFGLQEFVERNFFNGDLYVDDKKKTYQDMGYKRFNFFTVMASLLQKVARDAMNRNKTEQLPHNLQGDGLQNGGTLIVSKGGGKVLMDYHQENPADHVGTAEVLRVLGIQQPPPLDGSTTPSKM